MAKPKKTEKAEVELIAETKLNDTTEAQTEEKAEVQTKESATTEPSPRIIELMRLYPQYEEIWVTPKGFVHPKNAPKYLTKGATLFKNKYYKNK